MEYKVIGEEEYVEVLGVLRAPGEILSLRPQDVTAEVERGVLAPVEESSEDVPDASEAPVEGETAQEGTETPTDAENAPEAPVGANTDTPVDTTPATR